MTQTTPANNPPPRMAKWILNLQVGLLRARIIPPLNKALMVLTTTGRKSGKQHSIPIGYIPDGDTILTFNIGGQSNWYKNVLANGNATLEISGEKIAARGEPLTAPHEIRRAIDVYRQKQSAGMFERFFGVSPTADPEEQMRIIAGRIRFVRFHPSR
jgi:deazaflavin-dependent oxidoreductase (nitroreductase family)